MLPLLQTLTNRGGLLSRLFRGAVVMGAGTGFEQGFRFARNMVLTRILAPEALGLMAIVLSVCSLFQVLTGIGIKEAVVQNPSGRERTYLNGAWWLGMGRSTFLYVLAFLTAPFIATFYEHAELCGLLRVAFVNVLVMGAISPGVFVALKEMRYSRWVLVQQGGSGLGILTTLVLAFQLKGVWALVLGYVTEGVARFVLSYVICPFRPGLQFNREHLRALFRYARGIFGLPALTLVYSETSTFVVGKLCSASDLGLFAMTLALARGPGMVGSLLIDLLMPTFARMQHEPERVNDGLLKVTTVIAYVWFPALCFVMLYAPQLLSLVYGEQYSAGAGPLTVLFAGELLAICYVPLGTVFLAIGRPELLRRFAIVRAMLIFLMIYPAVRYFGLMGAAVAPLAAMALAYGFQLTAFRDLTGLALSRYALIFLRGLALPLPLLLVWRVSGAFAPTANPVLAMGAVLLASAAGYLVSLLLIYRRQNLRLVFWPFADGIRKA